MTSPDDPNAERAARLRRATGMLFRRIRAEAHGVTGLTLSQESIVALLMDAPAGLSSAELARTEGVRAQTMSTAVAALERRGFVRGEPDPTDRRRTVLRSTAEGSDALTRSLAIKQRWLQETLGDFTAAELATLDDATALIERMIDR